MAKVIINDFSGGMAEDQRELRTDTFSAANNFDVVSQTNTITVYPETESEALGSGDITDKRISDIVQFTRDGYIYAIGRTSAAAPTEVTLFVKANNTNIASTYSSHASFATGNTVRAGTLVEYFDNLYCVDSECALKLIIACDPLTVIPFAVFYNRLSAILLPYCYLQVHVLDFLHL